MVVKSKINLSLALIGVFLTAFILRAYKLSEYPQSLSMDEVTFGYSAYSVLNTGRDEQGQFLPLAFKGMGDYKPPVDVYLKVLTILLLGLNEFSVRIPGVILGSLTCVVLALFLIELGMPIIASLFSGFWLAFSGWHIFFSRAGYEAITALFFLILALYLFFIWVKSKKLSTFLASIVFFSISVWSYHAERIYIPVLFLFLIFYFKESFKKLIRKPSSLILTAATFLFFAIPFIFVTLRTPGVRARFEEVWLVKNPLVSEKLHNGNYLNLKEFLFDNDFYIIGENLIGQYISYFDLKFWFWKGIGLTPDRYPDVGLLYLIDIPIFFLGIYWLLNLKGGNTLKHFSLPLFFLGPLPGAIARGEPSPIRILVWVPFFGIVMGAGFWFLIDRIKNKVFWIVYIILLSLNIIYFYNLYFLNFHKYYIDLWHYGYKEVAQYVCSNYKKYEKIILTDKYGIEIPRIKTIPHYYILFHCRYDPKAYLAFRELFNLEIRQPQWRIDSKLKNALLIGSPWDFPEGFLKDKINKTIYFPNGKEAFYFVETGK